jgi:hypothetical protein
MTTWENTLSEWLAGRYPKYPKSVKSRFFFETSICRRDLQSPYHAVFVPTSAFENPEIHQDFKAFEKQITANTKTKTPLKYALAFPNLDGSSTLIIPVPKLLSGGSSVLGYKNYLTIRDFMDNASETQKREFWKSAAREIIKYLQTHDQVWVSTHGLGVPYFHLRLDPNPKYYKTRF